MTPWSDSVKPSWKNGLKKGGCILLLGAVSVALLLYAHGTRRIAAQDLSFHTESSLARFFPQSWALKGNLAQLMDLDTERAVDHFRRSVALQPLHMDAWLALARAEAALGNRESAWRVMDLVAEPLGEVSTWKWQEFLLAYETRDSERLASSFNFVLTRLPRRTFEASYLAAQFWGGWDGVLPHLARESRPVFMGQLMRQREVGAALALWKTMEREQDRAGKPVDERLRLRACNFFLGNGHVREAKKIWRKWEGYGGNAVHNGDFTREVLNTAFGWRLPRPPTGVQVERTLRQPYTGTHCLHLHFRGSENVNFHHVRQIIPVEPGATCTLRFARKSRGLSTDQGVFLEVLGHGCRGLRVQSTPVLGTSMWTREELEFTVPEDCETILLRVRRQESLRFDNKIVGDYWLDSVELHIKEKNADLHTRTGDADLNPSGMMQR